MGLEFLSRVRRTSLWLGAIASLLVAAFGARQGTGASGMTGVAVGLGAAWSLVNLGLLERLIVAITGPGRGEQPALRRSLGAIAGLGGLFVAGAVLLTRLSPAHLLAGFLIPVAVIVLKAVALVLLGSTVWRRFVADPRRPAAVAASAALVLGAWLVVPMLARATGGAQATATDSAAHGAAGEAATGETHAPAPGAHDEAGAADHGAPAHRESGANGHDEHGAASGPQKFANVITVLSRAFPDAPWARFLHHYEAVIFAMFVALLISLVAWAASRKAQMIPGPLQNAVEAMVEALYDFVVGILGPKQGRRYVPFLGTLFIYILAMNLFGLIPFMDSPTSSLNVTVALAITVFIYAQYIGFRELGPLGWLDHMAGNPRTPIQWGLVPLMLPIHLLGELAKPISLSCRLFGNVFGEDMLLVAFATLGVTTLAFTGLPIGLPLQLPFMVLALLTGTLQALVFTVLSTIYFLLMLPHDDHHDEHHASHTPAASSAH